MSVKPFKSSSVPEDVAVSVTPNAIPSKGAVAKIPVVLAEVAVQIPMHSIIKFDHPVLEIKQIKKHVKITQCRLLQPTAAGSFPKLFIGGFIRKNIQYASPIDVIDGEVNSRILSTTVDVPFEKVAIITKFLTPPIGPQVGVRNEFDIFVEQKLPHGFPRKDKLLANDLSEFHQNSTEFFNELIFCEPVRADIVEIDEALDDKPLSKVFHDAPFEEIVFTKVSEKTVLDLTLKILQQQQVKFEDHKNHNKSHKQHKSTKTHKTVKRTKSCSMKKKKKY